MIPEAVRWLAERWPARQREVRREYRLLKQSAPLATADLAQFCHAAESTMAEDALQLAYSAGRRDVWLHIRHMAALDQDDVDVVLAELRHERASAERLAERQAERPDDIFDQYD